MLLQAGKVAYNLLGCDGAKLGKGLSLAIVLHLLLNHPLLAFPLSLGCRGDEGPSI